MFSSGFQMMATALSKNSKSTEHLKGGMSTLTQGDPKLNPIEESHGSTIQKPNQRVVLGGSDGENQASDRKSTV